MGCIKSKQNLSQNDLEFLKAHTCYNENSIRAWYSSFIQDCPDGKMTQEKFGEMYQLFFPGGNAENFCHRFFNTFDTRLSILFANIHYS